MATILDKNLVSEHIDVPSQPCVVVSRYFEDALRLCDIVKELGHTPLMTPAQWPRDSLVGYKGVYASFDRLRELGEGGRTAYSDTHFLMSDTALLGVSRHKIHRYEIALGTRIHLVPVPDRSQHIDMCMLALDGVLLVDEAYFRLHHKSLEHITDVVTVEFLEDERKYFPLNCLVVDNVVICNSRTPTLHEVLKELHVDFTTVDAHSSYRFRGSIRCRTNEAVHPVLLKKAGIKTQIPRAGYVVDISPHDQERNSPI